MPKIKIQTVTAKSVIQYRETIQMNQLCLRIQLARILFLIQF